MEPRPRRSVVRLRGITCHFGHDSYSCPNGRRRGTTGTLNFNDMGQGGTSGRGVVRLLSRLRRMYRLVNDPTLTAYADDQGHSRGARLTAELLLQRRREKEVFHLMSQNSDSVTNASRLDDDCLVASGTAPVNVRPAKFFQRSDVATAVAEFHAACDLPRRVTPSVEIGDLHAKLRATLLEEECGEFLVATAARDLVAIADALADVVYVAYGTAVTYGIDLDLVLSEVHRANMSKLDESGKPIKRADGKVLKSQRYTPPDVKAVLRNQPPLVFPLDPKGCAEHPIDNCMR